MTRLHGVRGAENSPRRRPRGALAVALAAAILVSVPASAAPFVPADDSEVLEQLPEAGNSAARALRHLHQQLAHDPSNLELALRTAKLDLDQGRTLADPRYLGRAEAALAAWPDTADAPASVLLLRAVLRQGTHDFAAARTGLARVVQQEPRNAQAWLTRATIETVEANYPAALADCGKLALLDIGLAPTVCTASVISLTGHAQVALAALQMAITQNAAEPDAVRLWAATVTAELAARLGQSALAEERFADARRLGPADAYLLGAYADFLLDQQRPAEVVALLRAQTRADPLLLRLALAETALHRPDAAAHIADLQSRFETARLRGETIHRREEARFTLYLLHNPAEALRLAQANWQVQREPADARILLEAANAAGQPAQAAAVADWVRTNRVEDIALRRLLLPSL